eukprot:scaffold1001_cov334-Prasinococcus_capsulatus_cf.AAC.7
MRWWLPLGRVLHHLTERQKQRLQLGAGLCANAREGEPLLHQYEGFEKALHLLLRLCEQPQRPQLFGSHYCLNIHQFSARARWIRWVSGLGSVQKIRRIEGEAASSVATNTNAQVGRANLSAVPPLDPDLSPILIGADAVAAAAVVRPLDALAPAAVGSHKRHRASNSAALALLSSSGWNLRYSASNVASRAAVSELALLPTCRRHQARRSALCHNARATAIRSQETGKEWGRCDITVLPCSLSAATRAGRYGRTPPQHRCRLAATAVASWGGAAAGWSCSSCARWRSCCGSFADTLVVLSLADTTAAGAAAPPGASSGCSTEDELAATDTTESLRR